MLVNNTSADTAAFEAIVQGLETAWNDGDGFAYAAYFADDADFANILGVHIKGRSEIALGHEMIFQGVYAGSVAAFTLREVRRVSENIALVFVDSKLWVPQGAMAGQVHSMPMLVVARRQSGWEIVALQNTRVAKLPPIGPHGQSLN
jgi:uncharacterized protein (TIGR02246 family)